KTRRRFLHSWVALTDKGPRQTCQHPSFSPMLPATYQPGVLAGFPGLLRSYPLNLTWVMPPQGVLSFMTTDTHSSPGKTAIVGGGVIGLAIGWRPAAGGCGGGI